MKPEKLLLMSVKDQGKSLAWGINGCKTLVCALDSQAGHLPHGDKVAARAFSEEKAKSFFFFLNQFLQNLNKISFMLLDVTWPCAQP